MAKKKKAKWPYKYVSPHTLDELRDLSDEDLLKKVLQYDTNTKAEQKNKKDSAIIKENGEVIRKHRKQYEEMSQEFEDAKVAYEAAKEQRDEEIKEFIEEKADVEKSFNDAIKNFKEHREVCIKLLKERK